MCSSMQLRVNSLVFGVLQTLLFLHAELALIAAWWTLGHLVWHLIAGLGDQLIGCQLCCSHCGFICTVRQRDTERERQTERLGQRQIDCGIGKKMEEK